jgi:hypothetical protein
MCSSFAPRLTSGVVTVEVLVDTPTYLVLSRSAILQETTYESRCVNARWDLRGEDLIIPVTGILRRVRIIPVTRGPKKRSILLFYGRVDQLLWDPSRHSWNFPNEKGETPPFMAFSAHLGRSILRRKHVVPDVVTRKWGGILAPTYKLHWTTVWNKERVRKEAGLLWLT